MKQHVVWCNKCHEFHVQIGHMTLVSTAVNVGTYENQRIPN